MQGFINTALFLDGSPGSSGQVPVSQGANLPPIWTTIAAGGATLTGSTSEMLKWSSSTSGVGTKIFSLANGDLTFGDASLSGNRTLKAVNTAGTADFILGADGTSSGAYIELKSTDVINIRNRTTSTYIQIGDASLTSIGAGLSLRGQTNFDTEVRSSGTGNTLVNSTGTGNIKLSATGGIVSIESGLATKIVTTSSTITLDKSHNTVLVNAAGGAVSINLPTAASAYTSGIGLEYVVKKIDSSINAVTIDGDSSETIDGATTLALSIQWKYVKIKSDGTQWLVIGAG